MILDGKAVIAKNYVTFDEDHMWNKDEQIQPNGVDLRVKSVKHVNGKVILPRDKRIDAKGMQLQEIPAKNGYFELKDWPGNYLVDFYEHVSVPPGYCAIIITRSSLVRAGCDVITGLWDTGFQGRLGASLRLKNPVDIEVGARMAQVVFYKSVFSGHEYSGAYSGTTQSEFK